MKFFKKRKNTFNSILITIIIHLSILIILLSVKLQKIKYKHEETIQIELIEENEIQQIMEEKVEIDNIKLTSTNEDVKGISNIAYNKEIENLKNNLSTELYEKQVMKELGIQSLKNDFKDLENYSEDENIAVNNLNNKENEESMSIPTNKKTTIKYFLKGRYARKQYVPVYLCKNGGLVTINIVVDKWGKVIYAEYSKEQSETSDPCLIEEAIKSSYKFLFNSDENAPLKQNGYISFYFINQY